MKLIYYKYYLESRFKHYVQDIRKIFKTYLSDKSLNGTFFTGSEEPLYLFPTLFEDLYMFAMVRDDNLVKAIHKKTLSHTDIKKRLDKDESLGFVSYVYARENHLSIASTALGPRGGVWREFVTQLIQRLCKKHKVASDVKFCAEPFETDISIEEARKEVKFFGTADIRLNDESQVMSRIKTLFGGGGDIGTIEIIIRPPARKFFTSTKNGILDTFNNDSGVDKFVVRGKRDAAESLTDMYIVGSGHLSDNVTATKEANILKQIKTKTDTSEPLKKAVREFINEKKYRHTKIPRLPDIF